MLSSTRDADADFQSERGIVGVGGRTGWRVAATMAAGFLAAWDLRSVGLWASRVRPPGLPRILGRSFEFTDRLDLPVLIARRLTPLGMLGSAGSLPGDLGDLRLAAPRVVASGFGLAARVFSHALRLRDYYACRSAIAANIVLERGMRNCGMVLAKPRLGGFGGSINEANFRACCFAIASRSSHGTRIASSGCGVWHLKNASPATESRLSGRWLGPVNSDSREAVDPRWANPVARLEIPVYQHWTGS